MTKLVPINWNRIEDQIDLDVWNRLTANFWLPEKVPLAEDIQSWRTMTPDEQTLIKRVFAGLTLLDTIQGTVGAVSMIEDAVTPHEEAVLTYIAMNESVHAKSYSSIFTTLCSTVEIDEAFEWSENNEYMQYKANRIYEFFEKNENPWTKKSASVLLESFLFFSGFYAPYYFAARSKITNTADIISLILRDESLHQYFISMKYQQTLNNSGLSDEEKAQIRDDVYELVEDLMENEEKYTESLYDSLNLTRDVKAYLKYNANRALMALGYDTLYPRDLCEFDTSIKAALDPTGQSNHDFFSGAGSSYVMVDLSEEMDDEDWDF